MVVFWKSVGQDRQVSGADEDKSNGHFWYHIDVATELFKISPGWHIKKLAQCCACNLEVVFIIGSAVVSKDLESENTGILERVLWARAVLFGALRPGYVAQSYRMSVDRMARRGFRAEGRNQASS